MFALYAKNKASDLYFDYMKTVDTEEELEQWIETAVDLYEGIAWAEIYEGEDMKVREFEYDKESHLVDRRTSYIYVKQGEKIEKKTLFCIENTSK